MSNRIDLLSVSFVAFSLFIMGSALMGAGLFMLIPLLDPEVPHIAMAAMSVVLMGTSSVMAGMFAAVGIGLGRRMWWSRGAALALASLVVGSVPVGLALGVFSFVTLIGADVAKEFRAA